MLNISVEVESILYIVAVIALVTIIVWMHLDSKYRRRSEKSLNELQTKINAWQEKTFGQFQTIESCCNHMEREIDEIRNSKSIEELEGELADVTILAIGICGILKIDLQEAIEKKHLVNVKRRWKLPDGSGVMEHEKTDNA